MTPRNHDPRIFFALLPEPETRKHIEFHAVQFSPETGKRVKTENFHITLLFLGNVPWKSVDALCLDCEALSLPAFSFDIDQAGWWRKAGILWLAPASAPPVMVDLARQLGQMAARRRLARDKRDFFPHITLMRKVDHAPVFPPVRPFTWTASGYSLMQSITHPDGVEYRMLGSWPLMG